MYPTMQPWLRRIHQMHYPTSSLAGSSSGRCCNLLSRARPTVARCSIFVASDTGPTCHLRTAASLHSWVVSSRLVTIHATGCPCRLSFPGRVNCSNQYRRVASRPSLPSANVPYPSQSGEFLRTEPAFRSSPAACHVHTDEWTILLPNFRFSIYSHGLYSLTW